MITRNKYPYIYFFIEPTIVFVYKIETEEYVLPSKLSECGESWTYELRNDEDVETFHHEKSEPLVGRSYFLSMDSHKVMAKKINEMIRDQRFSNKGNSEALEVVPVHIASSEHVAGAIRFGMERPKKVIGLEGFFGIGPLWKLDRQEGRDARNDWLFDHINFFHMERYEYEGQFENRLLEVEDIPPDAPIYIWTANNGAEQTGQRFAMQLLKDWPNDVYLINTSDMYEKWMNFGEDRQTIYHTGEVHPEELKVFFEKTKSGTAPLTVDERTKLQQEWGTLSESTGLLRLWENGKIKEIPEDGFDELILKMISETSQNDFIAVNRLVGTILSRLEEKVWDAFFEYRIRYLVYTGVLEMKGVPKSMHHYRVKLR